MPKNHTTSPAAGRANHNQNMKPIPSLAALLVTLSATVAFSFAMVAWEQDANHRPLPGQVPTVKAIRRQEVGPTTITNDSGGLFATVVIFKCQRCGSLMCATGRTVAGVDGKTRFEYSCFNCRAGGLAENLYPMTLTRSVAEPVRLPAALTTNLSKLAELYITALPDKAIKWQYDDTRAALKKHAEEVKYAEEFNRTNTSPWQYMVFVPGCYIQFNPKPGDIEFGWREDGEVMWRTPPEVAK